MVRYYFRRYQLPGTVTGKSNLTWKYFVSFLINVSCRDRFARAHKKVFPVPVYLVVD